MHTIPKEHALETRAYWHEPLEYDVSNKSLLAQFNGQGGISKYSVAGEWEIINPNSWFTGWTINGKRPPVQAEKTVRTIGRLLEVKFDHIQEFNGVDLIIRTYCGESINAVYTQFEFINHGNESAKVFLRHGFDWNRKSYAETMAKTFGSYKLHAIEGTWDNEQKRWHGVIDRGYEVSLSSSHSAEIMELEQTKVILNFNEEIAPSKNLVITVGLSGGSSLLSPEDINDKATIAFEEAKRYENWLSNKFNSKDELLNSMFVSCLNTSYSSYKKTDKAFNAFFAGVNYQSPSRTYYRDGYWTVLPILPFKPEWVRNEIITLAYGIQEDGSCPSAVIYNNLLQQFQAFWEDHYDSPSFFIMMVHDYLAWTHDRELLNVIVNNKTILELLYIAIDKVDRQSNEMLSLLIKPNNERDWCDNVYREGLVAYDCLLHIRATKCLYEIEVFLNKESVDRFLHRLEKMNDDLINHLFYENRYLINYWNQGADKVKENNISIEQALAAVFGIGNKEQQRSILNEMSQWLETKNNKEQPYGDWGVMVCYPFYENPKHLRDKSMDPFRYHNGSDWPYWDGILSWAKLKHQLPDWEYPLTRWFSYSLEKNWLTPVEYYDPVYGKGSNLQGWSSMPAAAILFGGIGLWPSLNGQLEAKIAPWGDCEVHGLHFRGKELSIITKNQKAEIVEVAQTPTN